MPPTQLNPRHTKDDGLVAIANLYITEDRELMIRGACTKCGLVLNLAISFNELELNVPTNTATFTDDDRKFAHAMKISLGDENELERPQV